MANRFVSNPISYHGKGAIAEIPGIVAAKGFQKAFIATDPDLVKFGVAKKVTDILDAAGMANAMASGNSSAAAQRIADDLEQCLLSVWQEGVPLRLWCMGFSWGGKVADSVLSALVGRPALTGKFTTAGAYDAAGQLLRKTDGTFYVQWLSQNVT